MKLPDKFVINQILSFKNIITREDCKICRAMAMKANEFNQKDALLNKEV